MTDTARLKNIRIKTGVLKRITKEKDYYIQEAERESQKLETMKKDAAKDSHDIKKQDEVLAESLMMIPDCDLKMKKAYSELLELSETENDLSEAEEYKVAMSTLEEFKNKVEAR